MSLLLPLLGMILVAGALTGAIAVRFARRHGHRCTERTRPASCTRCAAVLRGEDRGGHLVCGCGAASPHLLGSELLSWRAAHHRESLPPLPGDAAVPRDAPLPGDAGLPGEGPPPAQDDDRPVRWTTRGQAAAAEEERVRRALAEELSETRRRMIGRARRNPDPITPQLLREAEEFGVRPVSEPRNANGDGEPAAVAAEHAKHAEPERRTDLTGPGHPTGPTSPADRADPAGR